LWIGQRKDHVKSVMPDVGIREWVNGEIGTHDCLDEFNK
jgi:hypothetical protein